MNRRDFLVSATASLAASTLTAEANSGARPTAQTDTRTLPVKPNRPNVIVMICDDLGYGDVGCYGSKIPTPNLDRLAATGIRCVHHSTPSPVCTPSRSALLSGNYPPRVNCASNFIPLSNDGMSLDVKTIADVLKPHGYKSMAIGKWHLGGRPEYLPTNRGFDEFYGVPYSVDMDPLPILRNTHIEVPEADRDMLTQQYTHEAVRFINESKDSPFFLYFAQSYPHVPIHASEKFRGSTSLGIYGDTVHEIDWSMGELVKAVRQNGLERNTLIIFTSDHGPWYQGSPGILRGRKTMTYEGGVRIPFVACLPGFLPENKTIESVTSHLDVMPTVASLCGAKLPQQALDGVDVLSVWTGEQEEVERKALLNFAGWYIQAARWKQWKLHISRLNFLDDVPRDHPPLRMNYALLHPELYNLTDDPAESYDVAPHHPEVITTMQQHIAEQLATMPDRVRQEFAVSEQHQTSPLLEDDAYTALILNSRSLPWAWIEDGAKREEVMARWKRS